ncbi:MAG: arsenic metallochaperone ArsD family protein [Halothiobacillaceae bacterium]
MCCSTGLCGPVLDLVLVAVNDALLALTKQGVAVARFNPVQQLKEVMANPEVAQAIHRQGKKVLPMVFVNGRLLKSGSYPSYEEFCAALGLQPLPKARPLTVLTAPAPSNPAHSKE